MFCQNIMGRESYLHSNRINAVDALMVHALLEKQAKAIKQQQSQLEYGDGPKITFIWWRIKTANTHTCTCKMLEEMTGSTCLVIFIKF